MNQPDEPRSEAQLPEQLVAYLDGELDAESAREVEQWLATDPAAREEMQRLERAWGMLEELPRAEMDETFTNSTIEMIALCTSQEVQIEQGAADSRWRRRLALGAAAVAAAAGIGFLTIGLWWPDPNEQLVRDLPVLSHLDRYSQVDGVEYLQALREVTLPDAEPLPAIPQGEDARQRHIASLDDIARERLRSSQQRFQQQFDSAEQQRLRDLHEEIQQQPDSGALRQTLARYHTWLMTLTPIQRAELLALDTQARVARVRQLREEELRRDGWRLSDDDSEAVARWLAEHILAGVPEDSPYLKMPPEQREGITLLLAWHDIPEFRPPELDDELLASLKTRLSDEGQAKLELSSDRERRAKGWFATATRDAIWRYFDRLLADVKQEELVAWFESLDEPRRSELLDLAPEWRQYQLRFMYLREKKYDQLPQLAKKMEPTWWRSHPRWSPYSRGHFGSPGRGDGPSGRGDNSPSRGRDGGGRSSGRSGGGAD